MSTPDHSLSKTAPAIGSRLRELRLLRGWTQQQLADELGIAKSTVSQYENNVNEPDLRMVARLCSLFAVSADDLLGLRPPAASSGTPDRLELGMLSPDEKAFVQASLEAYRLAVLLREN